jgi:ankyrin repeat protein
MSKKSKAKKQKALKAAALASRLNSVAAINANLWTSCRDGIVSSNDANVMSVQAAIAAGADVNYSLNSRSCLSIAVLRGHQAVVDLLITAGVDKEAKSPNGFTPLVTAAEMGHNKCVDLLLTAGANKDAKSPKGSTALRIAA